MLAWFRRIVDGESVPFARFLRFAQEMTHHDYYGWKHSADQMFSPPDPNAHDPNADPEMEVRSPPLFISRGCSQRARFIAHSPSYLFSRPGGRVRRG